MGGEDAAVKALSGCCATSICCYVACYLVFAVLNAVGETSGKQGLTQFGVYKDYTCDAFEQNFTCAGYVTEVNVTLVEGSTFQEQCQKGCALYSPQNATCCEARELTQQCFSGTERLNGNSTSASCGTYWDQASYCHEKFTKDEYYLWAETCSQDTVKWVCGNIMTVKEAYFLMVKTACITSAVQISSLFIMDPLSSAWDHTYWMDVVFLNLFLIGIKICCLNMKETEDTWDFNKDKGNKELQTTEGSNPDVTDDANKDKGSIELQTTDASNLDVTDGSTVEIDMEKAKAMQKPDYYLMEAWFNIKSLNCYDCLKSVAQYRKAKKAEGGCCDEGGCCAKVKPFTNDLEKKARAAALYIGPLGCLLNALIILIRFCAELDAGYSIARQNCFYPVAMSFWRWPGFIQVAVVSAFFLLDVFLPLIISVILFFSCHCLCACCCGCKTCCVYCCHRCGDLDACGCCTFNIPFCCDGGCGKNKCCSAICCEVFCGCFPGILILALVYIIIMICVGFVYLVLPLWVVIFAVAVLGFLAVTLLVTFVIPCLCCSGSCVLLMEKDEDSEEAREKAECFNEKVKTKLFLVGTGVICLVAFIWLATVGIMAQDYTLQSERLFAFEQHADDHCELWDTCLYEVGMTKSKTILDCRECVGSKSFCQAQEELYFPDQTDGGVDYECIDSAWLENQDASFDLGNSFEYQVDQFADAMTDVHKYFWPKFPETMIWVFCTFGGLFQWEAGFCSPKTPSDRGLYVPSDLFRSQIWQDGVEFWSSPLYCDITIFVSGILLMRTIFLQISIFGFGKTPETFRKWFGSWA